VYGPLVDGSVILYWLEFPIFLFDEEETCFVGALGWSDSASFCVVHYEFM
jgi:hypothetical protein